MDLGEIIKDALSYPTKNLNALLLYIVLGLLVGIVAVLTGMGSISTGSLNFGAGVAVGTIGIIVIICLALLMTGYSLDIVEFGINKRDDAPEVDFARQIINGLKYLVTTIVYMIIPIIVMVVLMFVNQTLGLVIGLILMLIFSFALSMGVCRLSKTESLSQALSIGESFNDLRQIGVGKVVITLIVATIVGFIIVFILSFILGLILSIAPAAVIATVVTIVSSILDAWLLFYENRVMGLLYSDIA